MKETIVGEQLTPAEKKDTITLNINLIQIIMEIPTLYTRARINEVGGTAENIMKAYADTSMSEDANLQDIFILSTK